MLNRLPKRLRRPLKVLLWFVILLFAFLLFERWRGQISLARYKRHLTAQGERLTKGELSATDAKGENGAPEIFDAYSKFQDGIVMQSRYPPKMCLMPSGRAFAVFREKEWIADKITNHWEQLAAEFKTNGPILVRIQRSLEKPVLDNHLDYSLGCGLPITNLAPVKKIGTWFGVGSQLALHEGRNAEALDYLIYQIKSLRLLQNDRIAISELVRIAMAAIAKTTTWEALQADGLLNEKLAAIQQAWQEQDFMRSTIQSLEGERIYGDTCYEIGRRSNSEAVKMLYWPEDMPWDGTFSPVENSTFQNIPGGVVVAKFFKRQVYCRIWRFAWSYQDERRYLDKMQRIIDILRRAEREKSYTKALPALDQAEKDFAPTGFYDRLRYPEPLSIFPLLHMVNRAMRAETDRSTTICAVALKRYQLRHGNFPESLSSLVPEFLASVPIDYMDGEPLKYHLGTPGSFTLYSVGEDGKDDNGDAVESKGKYRQNMWLRKDVVWPMPATPEEIEAWRKESAKN